MTKIAILGAPESGKSTFARALRKRLDQPADLIDGYVQKLSKRTDLVYGMQATYPMNYQIACERLTAEQEIARNPRPYTIIVGSIYETIVYTALRVNQDLYWNRDNSSVESTIHAHGNAAMRMLGTFAAFTADQDLLFFIPYDEKKTLDKGRSYEVAINKMLPEVLEDYGRLLISLEGTVKEKVDNALKFTRAYAENQAKESAMVNAQSDGGSRESD